MDICADLNFEPKDHRYWISRESVEIDLISTTQLIGGLGLDDTSNIPAKYMVAGSMRHLVIEALERGDNFAVEQLIETDPKLQDALDAYESFRSETGFKAEHVEVGLYCEGDGLRCGVAGRIDLVGDCWGGRALVDIKGTTKLRGYALQISAYCAMWEAQTGETIDKLYCVHLNDPSAGRYRIKEHSKDGIARQAFEAARVLRSWNDKSIPFSPEVAQALRDVAALEELK